MSYIYDNEYLQKDTTLVCHGPATGIQDINKPQTLENKVDIYDLSGRLLNTIPERGIYIKNGKKVIKWEWNASPISLRQLKIKELKINYSPNS